MPHLRQKDQRWSRRSSLALDVTLYCGAQLPFAARTRDIGIGGMFIETSAERLFHNAQVFVAFSIQAGEDTMYYRLATRVVRMSQNGAGLMFSDFSVDAVHTLKEILYGEEYF